MTLTDDQKAAIQHRIVGDLKQACLDLSREATELFDRFEVHGLEAAWEGDCVFVIARMEKAHEVLRDFLSRQATNRMLALGISPENLARAVVRGQEQVTGE